MYITQALLPVLAALPTTLALHADLALLYAGDYVQRIDSSYNTACVPFNYPDPAEFISVNPRHLVGADIFCDLYNNPWCRGGPVQSDVRGKNQLDGDDIVAVKCFARPIDM
ncbi:hypothetical protein BDV23DRAFT_178442 [Aspergillus alliaceus]|uniref:LysM domain-containing protein n=1 Tax=Petromyces alliaceus TaxID=209559 RepID=A0A5N7CNV4_PETAA|nr:hypothetical protein BDV23DRAFT_178442 [Aspergillus alliaceus]